MLHLKHYGVLAAVAAIPLAFSASMSAQANPPAHAGPPAHANAPDHAGPPFHAGTVPLTVPKAVCGPNDNPETALQGQVPAAMRHGGFEGFSCNLELIGHVQGDGASWVADRFENCAYHDTSSATAGRSFLGTPVFDVSDPHNPVMTSNLTTISMLDPWESLKVNKPRQLLTAVNSRNGRGGPEIDVYDLSADCRHPQLLSSVSVAPGDPEVDPDIYGHEGNVAPDGLTYYGSNTGGGVYYAIDIADPTHPELITTFDLRDVPHTPQLTIGHGLSISEDGNRAYVVSIGIPSAGSIPTPENATNGLVILDVSEVQARVPDPEIKVVSTLFFNDGSVAQHTIPVTIKGKPYVVFVDEAGSGGLSNTQNAQAACDAGLPLFPMARIIDISDETNPRIVSRLMLETHDPANCDQVIPDLAGLSTFTYGSHYCDVDDTSNATALACGYFNSGVRVFDIRNPARPTEIAYFNPPAVTPPPGSQRATRLQGEGQPDWCAAPVDFHADTGTLTTACQNYGFMVLKFRDGVWPFEDGPGRSKGAPLSRR